MLARVTRPLSTEAGALSPIPRTSSTPSAWATAQIASSGATWAGRTSWKANHSSAITGANR